MICEQCIKEDRKSIVYDLGGTVTMLAHRPHWDENGVRHSHNPNYHTMRYRCSNGHEWSISKRDHCPAHDCQWNESLIAAGVA